MSATALTCVAMVHSVDCELRSQNCHFRIHNVAQRHFSLTSETEIVFLTIDIITLGEDYSHFFSMLHKIRLFPGSLKAVQNVTKCYEFEEHYAACILDN